MTPKEKAEKYDEALRRARKLKEDPTSVFYEYSPSEGDTIADYIFPELKEDDEKIRKWLISQLKIKSDDTNSDLNIMIDKAINWLEKKGEQKFAEGTFVNVDDVREDFVQEVYRVLDADSTNDRVNQIIDAFDNLPTVTIEKQGENHDDKYNITGIKSKHAEGKLGEMIKKLKPLGEILDKQSEQKQGPCDNCKDVMLNCHNFPCIKKRAFKQGKSVLEVIKEEPQVYKTKDGEIITYSETDGYKVEQKPQGKTELEAINEEKVDNANKVEPKDYSSIDPHFGKPIDKVEPKFKVGDIIINIHYRWNGKHRIREITDGKYIFDSGSYIDIKEQDSWELANKVEPKFHEGQWIVWQDKYYKVNYNGCGYELIDQNGASKSLKYGTIDETAHHWGVSDAKDGDVLIDTNENFPFIFKQLKPCDIKTVIKNPLAVLGYCGIGGAGFTKGEGWGDTANCTYYPATKEQRNTLMKTMANAGYTFDFEKKELKKIENETEIPFSSKDSELIEESYYIPKGFHAEIYEDKVVIKKGEKPTVWSEDDESILQGIWDEILANKHDAKEYEWKTYDKFLTWLKSLKGRVGCEVNCTTTKEWSEEDEERLSNAVFFVREYQIPTRDKRLLNAAKEAEEWLKSLRSQNTWNPSDE